MKNEFRADQICFGLSSEHDSRSLATYLHLLGQPALATTLADRLNSEEVNEVVTLMSRLMREHLSEKEYHELFLGKSSKQSQPKS